MEGTFVVIVVEADKLAMVGVDSTLTRILLMCCSCNSCLIIGALWERTSNETSSKRDFIECAAVRDIYSHLERTVREMVSVEMPTTDRQLEEEEYYEEEAYNQ